MTLLLQCHALLLSAVATEIHIYFDLLIFFLSLNVSVREKVENGYEKLNSDRFGHNN